MRRMVAAGILAVLVGTGVGLYPDPYDNDGHSTLYCGSGFGGPGYSAEFNPDCRVRRNGLLLAACLLITSGTAAVVAAPLRSLLRRSGSSDGDEPV
ncbi:hypothetical protein [Kitasatospora cheerisanensis]|uniref:Uncharacterized protein n=1 Tax=Kitasatospora cheerisanensis KCTC 2395 TaxID=1348663 RepID=A0A066YSP8_9ACTN|nr:hypothetical protein [Kitasatospora cheerisanensis]KDN81106.1 hypothetical protein KCH_72000 [Kitasatospora cheerisanensis KCTC 2395]